MAEQASLKMMAACLFPATSKRKSVVGVRVSAVATSVAPSHSGQAGGTRAGTAGLRPIALEVPEGPDGSEVPKGCYFVVQDKPDAFDSRTISWVGTSDIVSTELYTLRWPRLLEKVK
jgi:hypothetical protein